MNKTEKLIDEMFTDNDSMIEARVVRWFVESAIAPLERTIKRLWITVLLLILIVVGTNIAWIIYESQWQYVQASTKIEQEVDQGYNNYIGNNGDIYNGETDSDNNN